MYFVEIYSSTSPISSGCNRGVYIRISRRDTWKRNNQTAIYWMLCLRSKFLYKSTTWFIYSSFSWYQQSERFVRNSFQPTGRVCNIQLRLWSCIITIHQGRYIVLLAKRRVKLTNTAGGQTIVIYGPVIYRLKQFTTSSISILCKNQRFIKRSMDEQSPILLIFYTWIHLKMSKIHKHTKNWLLG